MAPDTRELMKQYIAALEDERERERQYEVFSTPYAEADRERKQRIQELRVAVRAREPESGISYTAHMAIEAIERTKSAKRGLAEARQHRDAARSKREQIEAELLGD